MSWIQSGLRFKINPGRHISAFSNGEQTEVGVGTADQENATCWLGYELKDGNPGEEVCYWKDMTLVPHLLNLLTKRSIQASVLFAKPQQQSKDRKELAQDFRSEVVKLKDRHNARNGRVGLEQIPTLACF
jgi:hypothetical protein